MWNYLYFMDFLYFPEDKADYIPGVVTLLIFFCGAALATYFIVKKSKKDEEEFEEKYMQNQAEHKNESKM